MANNIQTESNPNTIWMNYMRLFERFYKVMSNRFKETVNGNPITWEEWEHMKKMIDDNMSNIHNTNIPFQINDTTQQQNESLQKSQKLRLSESQLRKVIRKTVKRIINEGKRINNRVPFPLGDMDFVNDDGSIETLRKDKFADQYTTPEAEAKRKERLQNRIDRDARLFYDGILKDTSLEANLKALKQGDDKWIDELSQWGAAQWIYFDPTEGKRLGATPLMELWEIDGMYQFIVRKGKEKEVLGY